MLAMHLARKHTNATYADIGAFFGGRSHSTVVAAEKKVRQWLDSDERLTMGTRTLRVRDVIERVESELAR
jgi:chromosomal replication initiator protein